jgi:hypothetical protein
MPGTDWSFVVLVLLELMIWEGLCSSFGPSSLCVRSPSTKNEKKIRMVLPPF